MIVTERTKFFFANMIMMRWYFESLLDMDHLKLETGVQTQSRHAYQKPADIMLCNCAS